MKMHKMTFTSEQLGSIINLCEDAINPDYPMSDPVNAHYQRIINKCKKELEKTEPEKWDFGNIETEEA